MATPSEALLSYKNLLKREGKLKHLEKLKNNEKQNPDGAKFEAVIYFILQSRGVHVEIGDDPISGGTDFICTVKCMKFAFEATSIDTFRMEKGTGLKNEQKKDHPFFGRCYQRYPGLYQKLEGKVNQVSKYNFPRIVGIGSFHNESMTIFRDVMADEYLFVFFIEERDSVLIPNQNLKDISAFILVGFGFDDYKMMGFLNPQPKYPFDIQLLPDVNFRKITEKGVKERTGEGEWTNTKGGSMTPLFPNHPLQIVH